MKTRKQKLKIITMVIAVISVFAAGDVLAFYDNCEPIGDLPLSVSAGFFDITLNSIEKYSSDCDPELEGVDTCLYKWNYTVKDAGSNPEALTGLNFLAMLIPDCCNEPKIYFDKDKSTPTNMAESAVAEGEDTLYFGRYNQQAYVIKVTPNSVTDWTLVMRSNTVTTTTALLKYGKKDTASYEIPGPGCAKLPCEPIIPPVRIEPRVQCFQFTADTDKCQTAQTWYATWAGTDPCAVDVYVADGIVPCDITKSENGYSQLSGEDLNDITIEGLPLTEALTNNSQCSEGWLRFTDPKTECNLRCYYSGGRKYCY
jgi:hypothetical protein